MVLTIFATGIALGTLLGGMITITAIWMVENTLWSGVDDTDD